MAACPFEIPVIFLFTLITIAICLIWKTLGRKKSAAAPMNWPVVGMLPALLQNSHRLHAYVSQVLLEHGGTFEFKGPWFCNMDMVITCDPDNIHHIFSKNFPNYPKGPEFRKIFDILGDGVFNADFELWEFHRRTTQTFLTSTRFYALLESAVWGKVQTGLFPVLDEFSATGADFDLQDVLQRFTFDSICKLVLSLDPMSLSPGLPCVPSEKAFNDTVEALLYRHLVPEGLWRVQNWLGIGKEGKLVEAWKAFDEFIYQCISPQQEDESSLLKAFRQGYEERNNSEQCNDDGKTTREFLRDTALNLMFAGRDTTSTCLTWLFWLIANNPSSEAKIRGEVEAVLKLKQGEEWRFFSIEDARKLNYLHGALCESLRLFPPVAIEHKAPLQPDVLPSGHSLQKKTRVIVSFHTTGRMEDLWGKDWAEFKPERWITPRGGVRHEPSYKFPAFNAGPRTCLGKEMAFIQMKMVAAAVVHQYQVELVEGHQVLPRDSIILQAKHGVRVRLSKRIIE